MKYIKTYERHKLGIITKNGFRPIGIGDKVVWIGRDRKDFAKAYTAGESGQARTGDICEIVKLKTIKGELYAKAKNVETGKFICSVFDASKRRVLPYNPEGHWWKFDTHFKHEEDSKFTPVTNKFNI